MKAKTLAAKSILGSAIVATLGLGAPLASANHIDFFEDGAFNLTQVGVGTQTAIQTGIPTTTTLGGQRNVSLNATSGTLSASLNPVNTVGTANDDDFMRFTGTPGSAGTLGVLIGAAADLNANFVDIPNSTNDWDRVRLAFSGNSNASSNVTVSLFSRGVGTATVHKAFGGGNGNLDFLLSEFSMDNPAFNANVFRDIDQASFILTGAGVGGFNFSIDSFNRNGSVAPPVGVVPEPSTFALLGLGLGGLGLLGWKRRRAKA